MFEFIYYYYIPKSHSSILLLERGISVFLFKEITGIIVEEILNDIPFMIVNWIHNLVLENYWIIFLHGASDSSTVLFHHDSRYTLLI
jgi:hypothetical protein